MTSLHEPTPPLAEIPIFDFRKMARARSWLCPGAAFEALGNPGLAKLTYAAGLLSTGTAIFLALNPSSIAAVALLLLLAVSTILWIAELIATHVSWPLTLIKPTGNGYIIRGAILWSLFALLAAIVLASYGALQITGSGMSPVVYEDDTLIFRRRGERTKYAVGQVILFRLHEDTKFSEPGALLLGRIMAGPGDKIYRRELEYYVNGVVDRDVAPDKPYPIALEIARHPNETVVPDGCYFVIQDAPDRGLDSRVLSWAHAADIVSNELYRVRGLPPWPRVE
jgi:signal peptidase I